ncbi:MAG TPA: protein kinase [Vicinamibacterales bacterium]
MDEQTRRATGTCPNCGRPLPPDAAEGLCAACLLKAGTEPLTADATSTTKSQSRGAHDGDRLRPDEVWGPYRIGRLIGRGGMGEVYEAEHLESGRRIALKVLRSRLENPDERARFLREGQLAASVSHPHTVYIFGSEEIAGTPAITMELLPGGTLKDRVRSEGPLPVPEAVSAILDVIGGLDAAQSAGILHRDIKPSNCFVDHDGAVKVGDFGLSISTLARDVRSVLATDSSGFQGTPQFAPPEQLRGEPLDVRADIYAVGATLHYLLTGRAPFDAPNLHELVTRVTNERAVSPRRLRRDIPAPLAAVVLQCLEKTPDRRPASYAELAALLRPFSTTTDRPASLSLRFMAGVVDALLVGALVLVWRTATLDLANTSNSPQSWTWLVNLAYYLCLEPIWGASLGKRLFGLRVRSTSTRPAIAIALRTLIFYAPNVIIAVLLIAFPNLPTGFEIDRRSSDNHWSVRTKPGDLQNNLTLILTAALFATARRRNGWAAVHDQATATLVVAPAGVAVRHTSSRAEPTAPAPAFKPRRCGPFTVTADLGVTPDGQLVAAFDPILRRPVWIHELSADSPAITPARRDVSRIGRLHWLAGRRSTEEHWDAFEAPDGAPLLTPDRFADTTDRIVTTWPVLKEWLLDLVNELSAAERDGTLPTLALDRLWVRHDGRIVLADFPVTIAGASSPAERTHGLTPVALMAAVATHVRSRIDGSGPQLPLSAHVLLDSWSGAHAPTLNETRTALIQAAATPAAVTPTRRAVPVAIAAVPAVMMLVLSLALAPALSGFLQSTDAVVLRWLQALNEAKPSAGSQLGDPAVRDAVELYVVGEYGARLRDPQFWNQTVTRDMKDERATADAMLARHPAVSPEELAAATTAIAPELDRINRETTRATSEANASSSTVVGVVTFIGVCFSLVISLLSSLIVPGGLVTRLIGLAVVRRDGHEIGRLRSFGRAVLMWLPGLIWIAWIVIAPRVGSVPAANSVPRLLLLFGVFAAGITWTLVNPARGPHDQVAGTWVVPR